MEIFDFFEPVDINQLQSDGFFEEGSWFHAITFYDGHKTDITENKKIVIIGIDEPFTNTESATAVRKQLYKLKRLELAADIIDIGNFKFNYQPKAYESLGFVLSELLSANFYPIIINGRQDITFAQYLAFTYLKNYVNLATFDARIDFDLKEHDTITADNYLQKVFMYTPSYLFSCNNIGYQSYFTDNDILDFYEKLFFEAQRIGDVRANINDLEPVLRNVHFTSWDLSSIRQSDCPGTLNPSPNGFYGEECCLLSRYAGLSSNMRSIGFYNYLPEKDRDNQSAMLCAQMIWYYVEGFNNRYPESPAENKDEFTKFITSIENNAYQIVFYKSPRTDRWWMEIPITDKELGTEPFIIPCSYNDYLTATREEVPDRWLFAVKKMS